MQPLHLPGQPDVIHHTLIFIRAVSAIIITYGLLSGL